MAKNKVYVDVVVDDKGTTKKVALSAKQAAKAFGETGKAAGTADRNIKGAGQSTNNTTKAFSKMQQGTGGLVGAYASLAAQIFAISAAFNFLKRAGDLKVLQAGQTAYASATGVAMRTLAKDITEATAAQITFQDASQAAAIGTAAGLSRKQLVDLGTAAKDVSIILGRDVTDSFNRLVRGVTKAEPELLDELGVILRLEDATEKYAAQLGKSAKDLTAFERSQAVANDVLDQTQSKYSRILAVTGGSTNIYAQLGKSFDDVLMSVKEVVDVIAGPFAKVLKDTPALAIASLGLLLQGPLKALGFSFKDITADAQKSAAAAQAYYEKVSIEAKKATLDQKQLAAQFQETAAKAATANTSSPVLQRASLGTMTKTDKANLAKALKSAENNYNKHGIVVKGIFKGMSREMVADIALAFEQMNLAEEKKLSRTKVYATKASALYAGMTATIKSAGAALATFGTRLLSVLGYIGIAITIFQLLKDAFGFEEKLSAQEELYRKNRESLAELNKELKTFAEVQKILAENSSDYSIFGNIGAAIGQRSTTQALEDFKLLQEALAQEKARAESLAATRAAQASGKYIAETGEFVGMDPELAKKAREARQEVEKLGKYTQDQKDAKRNFEIILEGLTSVEEGTGMTLEAFREFRRVLEEGGTAEEFEAARVRVLELNSAIQESGRLAKDVESAITSFVNSFAPLNSAEQSLEKMQARLDYISKLEAQKPTYQTTEGMTIRGPGGEPMEVTYTVVNQGLNPELVEEKKELIRQSAIITAINEQQHKQELDKLRLQESQSIALRGQTEIARDVLQASHAVQNTEQEITNARDKHSLLLNEIKDIQKKDLTPAQKREKERLEELIKSLEARLGIEQDIANLKKIQEPFLNEIERQQNIQYVLNAEKEILSVAQKRLQLEQQRISIMESRTSREIEQTLRAERQNNPFAYLTEDRRRAELEYQRAVDLAKVKKDAIDREAEIKKQLINLEYALLDAKLAILEQELAKRATDTEQYTPEQRAEFSRLSTEVGEQRGNIDSTRTSAIDAVDENAKERKAQLAETVAAAKEARDNLQEVNKFMDDIGRSIESNLTSALTSLIDGTKSAKEAFADMAVAILKDIAAMIAKQLVLNALIAATGGAGGFFGSLFAKDGGVFEQARDGGIISEGKKVPGYSSGGVARGSKAGYPAILHGTEAVVPLPNNRSIPVELKGAGGQQNNVTVNVAVDNNGNAQQNTQAGGGPDGAALGKAIAAAVQKELMNQKRPGGMLSPHGVA